MPDANPDESPDLEGQPDQVEDTLPGKDIETLEEGATFLPRDHSIAAGSDPAYPVTVHEQMTGESVAERAAAEQPDFGEPGGPGGGLALDADGDPEEIDADAGQNAASAPEEAAMHVERH